MQWYFAPHALQPRTAVLSSQADNLPLSVKALSSEQIDWPGVPLFARSTAEAI
jgi:hypothetical protein